MGKIAFVFSGQGAQHAAMGTELCAQSPAARALFDLAEELHPGLKKACFSEDAEALSDTRTLQPVLFTLECALSAAAEEMGLAAEGTAGFSLGEWSAVTHAKMLSFEKALPLVALRAEKMSMASRQHPGAMLAVLKLPAEAVEKITEEFDEAWPVNYNSAQQTVVACRAQDAEAISQSVKAEGGRAMPLKVSGGFHTPWMRPASEALQTALAGVTLTAPQIPVYANSTGLPYALESAGETLSLQASSPVHWVTTIQNMCADGFDAFLELGPGNTLAGLIHRIAPNALALSAETPEGLRAMLEATREARRKAT